MLTVWSLLLPLGFTSTQRDPAVRQLTVQDGTGHDTPPSISPISRRTALLDLHRQLVQIESVTNDEHHLGMFLDRYLKTHGFTVERQRVPQRHQESTGTVIDRRPRDNLYAYPGHSREARVLLTSHLDTVPPFYNYSVDPDGSIWGRGVVDDKACVAVQTIAALELLSADTSVRRTGDLALLFVVGEEKGGDGMRKVNDLDLKWETVIFGEPTEMQLACGHKGNLGFVVHATGRGGHSGYPELGVDANLMLIRALVALADMDMPRSEKYGNSTLNIGRIEGGVAGNVISEQASAEIQIRIADGTAAQMKDRVLEVVKRVEGSLHVEWASDGYGPVDIDCDVSGFAKTTVNYGTDVPNLQGDHKRYLYGPGSILVAHSDHENLSPDDLVEAVHGYKTLVKTALDGTLKTQESP